MEGPVVKGVYTSAFSWVPRITAAQKEIALLHWGSAASSDPPRLPRSSRRFVDALVAEFPDRRI